MFAQFSGFRGMCFCCERVRVIDTVYKVKRTDDNASLPGTCPLCRECAAAYGFVTAAESLIIDRIPADNIIAIASEITGGLTKDEMKIARRLAVRGVIELTRRTRPGFYNIRVA